MRHLLAAAAAALSIVAMLAVPAEGADRSRRFAVDGAGAAPCTLFLDARAKRDGRYMMFGGWIEGFTTAMNIYEEGTFDVTPWQNADLLAAAVARYCQRNRGATMHQALAAVARELMAGRLRERSPMLVAGEGARGVPVYAATLTQAQQRLRALGHLRARPSGRYDTATRDALTAFQRARRLPATGLPDQATLLLLLQPGAAGSR